MGSRGGQAGEIHVLLERRHRLVDVPELLVALRNRKVRLRHLVLAVCLHMPPCLPGWPYVHASGAVRASSFVLPLCQGVRAAGVQHASGRGGMKMPAVCVDGLERTWLLRARKAC